MFLWFMDIAKGKTVYYQTFKVNAVYGQTFTDLVDYNQPFSDHMVYDQALTVILFMMILLALRYQWTTQHIMLLPLFNVDTTFKRCLKLNQNMRKGSMGFQIQL